MDAFGALVVIGLLALFLIVPLAMSASGLALLVGGLANIFKYGSNSKEVKDVSATKNSKGTVISTKANTKANAQSKTSFSESELSGAKTEYTDSRPSIPSEVRLKKENGVLTLSWSPSKTISQIDHYELWFYNKVGLLVFTGDTESEECNFNVSEILEDFEDEEDIKYVTVKAVQVDGQAGYESGKVNLKSVSRGGDLGASNREVQSYQGNLKEDFRSTNAQDLKWLELTELFREAIIKAADKDFLTISTETEESEEGCSPYVQIAFYDDEIVIEAVSNRFLSPKLSAEAHNKMIKLGWQIDDDYMKIDDEVRENYYQSMELEESVSERIAELFVKTFRDIYLISPFDEIHFSYGD